MFGYGDELMNLLKPKFGVEKHSLVMGLCVILNNTQLITNVTTPHYIVLLKIPSIISHCKNPFDLQIIILIGGKLLKWKASPMLGTLYSHQNNIAKLGRFWCKYGNI